MRRVRDLNLACGRGKPGALNSIGDVPGVTVGHATLADGAIQTGVTAIRPHSGNLYRDKVVAGSVVLNGFGKSVGLVQVAELGTLETPILLTNTLSVGTCSTALIRRAIAENPDIGRETATVNPVVMECNDGFLNDIQALKISEADARAALDTARSDFSVGAIGAGRGMSCFGFKGGIGSSSRKLKLDGEKFHLGVLALCNFGRAGDLTLPDGLRVAPPSEAEADKGSVILVMATDVPLDDRQIRRIIARAGVGLARVGSFWGHGSGDIAIGFTTANRVNHDEKSDLIPRRILNESRIDRLFEAMADATQEAIYDALAAAEAVTGRDGNYRPSLAAALGEKQ